MGQRQDRRALLEPVHRLAAAPRRRRPRRRPRLRHALDMGPPVSDRRRLGRPQLRGLADARRVGAGDPHHPHRPDGRRQHVPGADAHGEAGDDARPHLGRAGHPGHRRRLVRRGARGLRARVRVRVSGAAALARRGAAGHARDARRHRAHRPRRPLPREGDAEPAGAGAGPPADLHRRGRRAGHAQARREVRRHEQRRRRHRVGAAQGAGPRSSTASRSAAIPRRSSARPGSGRSFIRDDRAEAERLFHEAFDRNRVAHHWEDQPVGTPGGRRREARPVPRARLPAPDRRLPGRTTTRSR